MPYLCIALFRLNHIKQYTPNIETINAIIKNALFNPYLSAIQPINGAIIAKHVLIIKLRILITVALTFDSV